MKAFFARLQNSDFLYFFKLISLAAAQHKLLFYRFFLGINLQVVCHCSTRVENMPRALKKAECAENFSSCKNLQRIDTLSFV